MKSKNAWSRIANQSIILENAYLNVYRKNLLRSIKLSAVTCNTTSRRAATRKLHENGMGMSAVTYIYIDYKHRKNFQEKLIFERVMAILVFCAAWPRDVTPRGHAEVAQKPHGHMSTVTFRPQTSKEFSRKVDFWASYGDFSVLRRVATRRHAARPRGNCTKTEWACPL